MLALATSLAYLSHGLRIYSQRFRKQGQDVKFNNVLLIYGSLPFVVPFFFLFLVDLGSSLKRKKKSEHLFSNLKLIPYLNDRISKGQEKAFGFQIKIQLN